MTVGNRIRKARKAKGLTQEELAKSLGVSFAMIGQYERGERNPKLDTLQRIADALGVNVGVLLYGENSTTIDRDGVKYSGKYIPQDELSDNDIFDYRHTDPKTISTSEELGYKVGKMIIAGENIDVAKISSLIDANLPDIEKKKMVLALELALNIMKLPDSERNHIEQAVNLFLDAKKIDIEGVDK